MLPCGSALRMADCWRDLAVEPFNEAGDVGVDGTGCSGPGSAEEESLFGAQIESRKQQIAHRYLLKDADSMGGFVSHDPRDRGGRSVPALLIGLQLVAGHECQRQLRVPADAAAS
jgi:hypothetical protein